LKYQVWVNKLNNYLSNLVIVGLDHWDTRLNQILPLSWKKNNEAENLAFIEIK